VGFEPERELRQLDCQRVFVDAIEAVDGDQAAAECLGTLLGEAGFFALG
jgi:hypothetical protein